MLDLSEEQVTEITSYVKEEIYAAESERSEKERMWRKWRRQRESRPEHEVKTYPFRSGSSNVSVPLSTWNATTTFGHLISTFNVKEPFWTISALRDDPAERKRARVGTKYMRIISKSKHDLDLASKRRTVLYESGTLGMCPVKVPWTKRKWHFKYENDEGMTEEVNAKLHDGPELVPIPLEDFLYREAFQDIQQAPWVAHVVHKPWHEVKNLGEQGIYLDVEDIEEHARSFPKEYQEDIDERRGVSQGVSRVYDVHEVWMYYDVDEDGMYEDIVVTMHVKSGTILRSDYNQLGYRPFENFIHMLRPYYIDGIGTCWMSEHMQDEVDMWHNLRSDSAKISTVPMFAVRRNSGIQANEQAYPGKLWFVDDPKNDIVPMRASDSYPSSMEAESMAIMYSQKATAMPDVMGGFANSTLKTRDSIGLNQTRLQQSQGVFSSITEGISESFSNVGFFIFLQLAKHRDDVIENERYAERLTEEELGLLDELLSIPFEEIPVRFSFTVRTTDIEKTFETRRQNYLTLTQLYSQFLKEVTPVAFQLFGESGQKMRQSAPGLYKYFMKVFEGANKLMEEIFKFFGEEDTQDYIPYDERMVALQQMMDALRGQVGGMGNAGTGAVQQPGGGQAGGGPQGPGGTGGGPGGPGAQSGFPGGA